MARTGRMRAIDVSAEFSLISPDAGTFPVDAVAMSVAVGDFAFVVAKRTLFAFPSGVALTLAVDVFPSLATEDWANA